MPYPGGNATGVSPSTPGPYYSHQVSSSGSATKVPLTPDQLSKLYSMGTYGISPRPPAGQYVQPYGYQSVTSPISCSPHLLSQQHLFNSPYQGAAAPAYIQQSQIYGQTASTSAAVSVALSDQSSSNYSTYSQHMNLSINVQQPPAIAQMPFGNVANPESALVHVPKVNLFKL